MSGIKRVIAEKDPDYEEITITHPNKRHKAAEQSGRSCLNQRDFLPNGIRNAVDVHAVCRRVGRGWGRSLGVRGQKLSRGASDASVYS